MASVESAPESRIDSARSYSPRARTAADSASATLACAARVWACDEARIEARHGLALAHGNGLHRQGFRRMRTPVAGAAKLECRAPAALRRSARCVGCRFARVCTCDDADTACALEDAVALCSGVFAAQAAEQRTAPRRTASDCRSPASSALCGDALGSSGSPAALRGALSPACFAVSNALPPASRGALEQALGACVKISGTLWLVHGLGSGRGLRIALSERAELLEWRLLTSVVAHEMRGGGRCLRCAPNRGVRRRLRHRVSDRRRHSCLRGSSALSRRALTCFASSLLRSSGADMAIIAHALRR